MSEKLDILDAVRYRADSLFEKETDDTTVVVLNHAAAEIDRLRTALAAAERDAERLNWLIDRGLAWRGCFQNGWAEGEWLYDIQDARKVIDAARDAAGVKQ